MQKHEFALYSDQLTRCVEHLKHGDIVHIENENLYHRIVHILRLKQDETILLFDTVTNVRLKLTHLSTKKKVEGVLEEKKANILLEPSITVMLPLLKKEALEEALYSCVELGAQEVQLMITDKVQRSFGGEKELLRLRACMIAAAEQSKQFAIPILHKPVGLQHLTQLFNNKSVICADIHGQHLENVINGLREQQGKEVLLIVGPEGDFTAAEKELLKNHAVQCCALTPTILRSQQAVAVALGILRSMMR